ncbi:DUF1707 SHOCT-like domain-containing protein [Actinomadura flavalba]|uniref:DUF1707 SHOCT-like domain-containing protein n=1 Tax=Actinomadura flavalba TaxID=1120938 RepID=UPI0005267A13|nr:DUF1707 domain-containing protein [Actinomadura flavalba]
MSAVSDVERDRVVRRVQEAYAAGAISHEEMDARLGQVFAAGTPGELEPVLAALPAEDEPATATIAAVSGRIRRRGAWRVPRILAVESALGSVRLNFARAVIEHPEVDVRLALGTGGGTIILPRDATVEFDDLQTPWKPTIYTPPRRPASGGPTIRVSGTLGFGRLRIRHARR